MVIVFSFCMPPGISGPLWEVSDLICDFLEGLFPPTVLAFSEIGLSDSMLFYMLGS